jgi:hypothetical protein
MMFKDANTMRQNDQLRLYLALKNTPGLLSVYRRGDLNALTRFTLRLLRAAQQQHPPGKQQDTRTAYRWGTRCPKRRRHQGPFSASLDGSQHSLPTRSSDGGGCSQNRA